MTKDAKDNRRGCFIMAAIVALAVAALAFAILRTGDDPRSNGIAPSGSPPAGASDRVADPARPKV